MHYNFTEFIFSFFSDYFIDDSFVGHDVIITSSLLGGHLITKRVAIKTFSQNCPLRSSAV